jgi:hypothetical protein
MKTQKINSAFKIGAILIGLTGTYIAGYFNGQNNTEEYYAKKPVPEYHIEINRQKNHIMSIDLQTSMNGLEPNRIRINPDGTIEDITKNNQNRLQITPFADYQHKELGLQGTYNSQINLQIKESRLLEHNSIDAKVCQYN